VGDVTVTRVGTQAVVRLFGEVDLVLEPRLALARDEVAAMRCSRVAVDLDAVTFIDSVGAAFLVGLAQDCAGRALAIRFVDVPPVVRRLLEVTGEGAVLRARRVAPA
jgi:anti-anti-sigma factor